MGVNLGDLNNELVVTYYGVGVSMELRAGHSGARLSLRVRAGGVLPARRWSP